MVNDVNINYSQVDRFKRERLFEAFDTHYLRISSKSSKRQQEYTVDMIALSPEGKRVTLIAWKWLGMAVLFLLVAVSSVYYLASHFDLDHALALLPVTIVSLLLSGASAYRLFCMSERKYVFYTNYAGHPLVEILLDKPDKKGFDEFIEVLRERICQIALSHKIPKDSLQAGEMKMLRRLSEKNILTSDEYEKAKIKIFSNKG